MALGTKPSLQDVRDEFDSPPSPQSLREFYTTVIGTSEGASSGGSGGRLSHFANTGKPSDVNTTSASSVSETVATLNGQGRFNVQPNSALRQYRFLYAPDGDFIGDNDTGWQTDNSGSKNSLESVSESVTGLDDDTTYNFQVQFRNGFGVTTGDIEQFTTDAAEDCRIVTGESAFLNTMAGDAIVSWSAPSGGDSPVTYQIERRISSDGSTYGSWVTLSTNASSPYTNNNYCSFAGNGYYIQYRIRTDCGGYYSSWNQTNTLGPISGCGV